MSAPGPQKRNSGNWPEPLLQLVAQLGRIGVDVGQLAAVGRIHRPRRHRDVGGRVHVVPPEQLGAGERGIAPARGFPQLSRRRPGGSTAATARPRRDRGNTSRWRRCRDRAAAPPVTKVDCTVVVTAGVTVVERAHAAARASAFRFGACASSAGVSPTTLSTSVRFMNRLRLRATRRAWPPCVRFGRGVRERHARANNAARAIVRRCGRGLRASLRAASPEHFSATLDPSTQPSQKVNTRWVTTTSSVSRDRSEGVRSPSIPNRDHGHDRCLGEPRERRLDAAHCFDVGRFEQRVIVRPVGSGPLAANFHIDRNEA